MANIIFNHQPDSVMQQSIQPGDKISLSANNEEFIVHFENPRQFKPPADNPTIVKPGNPIDLFLADQINDCYINFYWICSKCGTTNRPARIIVGTVRCDNQIDRIENKLDLLISEVKKIENKFNIN